MALIDGRGVSPIQEVEGQRKARPEVVEGRRGIETAEEPLEGGLTGGAGFGKAPVRKHVLRLLASLLGNGQDRGRGGIRRLHDGLLGGRGWWLYPPWSPRILCPVISSHSRISPTAPVALLDLFERLC